MKALIPAAGLGTRYLPLSKAIPKELIPVGKFPVLHHVVLEAKEAGCSEIGIILSEGKEAIRQYFSWDEALMKWLDSSGKRAAMTEWEALMEGLSFVWIDQAEQRGLGDAIACGEAFIGDEAFCVLLGDTIMEGGSPLPEMVSLYKKKGQSVVAVEPVSPERATRYGVCGGKELYDGTFQLESMIEKPSIDSIPEMYSANNNQAYAFSARYVLSPSIFPALRNQSPGKNGEIQLTDAMAAVLAKEGFNAVAIPGKRRDIGSPETFDL